ncbi:MAG: transrane sensor [Acidobacteriota bacterium]|jgi:hypothetical protein|nr:transrane sensor [Acidobacteriota bacterium]
MDERDQTTEEETVRRLLESAGPRPPIPQEDLDAISQAARSAWLTQVRQRTGTSTPRPRRPQRALVLGMAAALALAVGFAWWGSRRAPTPSTVSWIEALSGPVLVQTVGGVTVRLHAETRLRFVSAAVLALERGAIYVDTGSGPRSSTAIVVRTPLGTVRDVGTRFAIQVVDPETLLVRVRDGEVLTEHQGRTDRTPAGQELVLRRDGTVERHAVAIHGPAWEWVLETAPGFEIEGRSLREFLDWVSRETGWQIVFADPELARSAGDTVLHGSLGGLRPDRAPFAVLPGAGLEGKLEDGKLVIRRR